MQKNLFLLFLLVLSACGGGSSGTAIGGDYFKISGIVLSPDGTSVPNTQVTLINSDVTTYTDDSGAFELRSEKIEGDAALSLKATDGSEATVTLDPIPEENTNVEVSVVFDTKIDHASILDITLTARVVRSCSPFFLNSRTIRQISPIPDNFVCTIEATIKNQGFPADNLTFELQYKSCDDTDEWITLGINSTGTSGPGTGEIDFNFTNDINHCLYRIYGPIEATVTTPLNVQINTLINSKE